VQHHHRKERGLLLDELLPVRAHGAWYCSLLCRRRRVGRGSYRAEHVFALVQFTWSEAERVKKGKPPDLKADASQVPEGVPPSDAYGEDQQRLSVRPRCFKHPAS
jgi:hypothetical protein